jgi:tight adherence protein B
VGDTVNGTVAAAAFGVLTVVLALCVASALRATRRARLVIRLGGRLAGDGPHAIIGSNPVAWLRTPPPWFARAVSSRWPAVRVDYAWLSWLAGVAAVAIAFGTTAGPGAAVAGTALAAVTSVVFLRAPDRRSDGRIRSALPSALEAVARSLRAGGSVRTALADAAGAASEPLAGDLDRLVRTSERGIPLREVIDDWSTARPLPGVRLAAAALTMGLDSGAGLARTLDGVAATLHERAAIEREVRVLAAQARYSAGVLILAPVAFLGLVAAFDPGTVDFLIGTPLGLGCLAAGLALNGAGAWWMARICREAR